MQCCPGVTLTVVLVWVELGARCYLCPHQLQCGRHSHGFRVLRHAELRCVEWNKNKCWTLWLKLFRPPINPFFVLTGECSMLVSRLTSAARCPLLSLKASPRPAAGAAYQVAQEVEQKHAEKPDDELSPCYVAATVPQYNYSRHSCHHTSKP